MRSLFKSLVALLAVALLVSATPAHAQEVTPELDARNFTPTPGPHGVLTTEKSEILGHLELAVRAIVDYANDPLVLETDDGTVDKIVDGQSTLNFTAAFGFFDWVELGIVLPFVLVNEGTWQGEQIDDNTIGDMRVQVKGRFMRNEDFGGFGLGAVAEIGIPIGSSENFVGNGSVFGRVGLVMDFTVSVVTLALNVGATLRDTADTLNITQTHEFDARFGVDVEVVEGLLHIVGDNWVEFPLGGEFGDLGQQKYEWLLGAKLLTSSDIHFTAAGGGGIGEGVGTPDFRVVFGIEYAALNPDRDGDGILNEDDDCPGDPEDVDGFEDTDGCPDLDNDGDDIPDDADACPDDAEDGLGSDPSDGCPNPDTDGDGIPDATDQCVDEPEDEDGFEDEDGCPEADNDEDGIPDDTDNCVNEPEDLDGYQDTDGCPDTDNDGDGILDENDKCPSAAEDEDGFEDEDGCPDNDNDKDGVLDKLDKCPNEKEVINGVEDEDGCPDEGKTLVIVKGEKIEILDKVFFETGKSLIKPESYNVLNQVALTLKANDQIKKVRVEGHTDDQGELDMNMELSQDRAQAVVDYLVGQGVEKDRLEAVGFGPTRPLVEGKGKKARAKNRRVEFVIIDQ